MKKTSVLIAFVVMFAANCSAQGWVGNIGRGFSTMRYYIPIVIFEGARTYNRQMESIRTNINTSSYRYLNSVSRSAVSPVRVNLNTDNFNLTGSTFGKRFDKNNRRQRKR